MNTLKCNSFRSFGLLAIVILLVVAGVFGWSARGGAAAHAGQLAQTVPVELTDQAMTITPVSAHAYDPPIDPLDLLIEILELLLRWMRQPLPEGSPTADQWMVIVMDAFLEYGFSPELTPQEKADALDALNDAEVILGNELEGVDPEIVADFLALIPDMEESLE